MIRRIGLSSAVALAAAVATAAVAGCDPNAKASDSRSRDGLSRAWESCASSLDCDGDLRCFQNMCRSTVNSVQGDYLAAVGARALAQGNLAEAIRGYSEAVTQYQAGAPEVPAWLYCELGHALTAASSDPDNAERGARALHRCIRQVPAGSAIRVRAMADLAVLGDQGLDPVRLELDGDAEKYMTKGPKRPPSDKIKVSATGDAKRAVGSYQKFLALMETPEVRESLLPCWEANWKDNKEDKLSVTLPYKYYFQQGEYEEDDRYVLKFGGDAPTAGPEACVYNAVSTHTADFHKKGGGGGWSANITITLE